MAIPVLVAVLQDGQPRQHCPQAILLAHVISARAERFFTWDRSIARSKPHHATLLYAGINHHLTADRQTSCIHEVAEELPASRYLIARDTQFGSHPRHARYNAIRSSQSPTTQQVPTIRDPFVNKHQHTDLITRYDHVPVERLTGGHTASYSSQAVLDEERNRDFRVGCDDGHTIGWRYEESFPQNHIAIHVTVTSGAELRYRHGDVLLLVLVTVSVSSGTVTVACERS